MFLHSLSVWSNRICGMAFGFNLLHKEKRPHGERTSKLISAKQILKRKSLKDKKNEIKETNMGTSEKIKAKARDH